MVAALVAYAFYAIVTAVILWPFAKAGDWLGHFRKGKPAPLDHTPAAPAAPPASSPADWPRLRAAGLGGVADRLVAEERSGRMNDVDCVRIRRAWTTVQADPSRLTAFTDAVAGQGARACLHPSGDRDLPARAATHDLLTSQVRIGRYPDTDRTPATRRARAPRSSPPRSARRCSRSDRSARARRGTWCGPSWSRSRSRRWPARPPSWRSARQAPRWAPTTGTTW